MTQPAGLPYVGADEIAAALDPETAVGVLERALLDGLDPEAEPSRQVIEMRGAQLFLMPSVEAGRPFVKLLTVGGEPQIQGICLAFDPDSLAPLALLDGVSLTALRTAAVSALAVKHLARPEAERLLVFGRGPQAHAHVAAITAIRPISQVEMVGRDAVCVAELVREADVVCCCTTSRQPLFDGADVADTATVVAVGSHEPSARETDDALARRSTVVVEGRACALREAGDVIGAIAAGALAESSLVTLAELVGGAELPAAGPRFFKSVGMAWEDAVLGAAAIDVALSRSQP